MNDLELETQIQLQTTDLPYEMVWDFGVASLGNPVGGRFISNAKYCNAPNRNHTVILQVEKGKVKSFQLLTV